MIVWIVHGPSQIPSVETVHGISDHHIILFKIFANDGIQLPSHYLIPNVKPWRSINIDVMRTDLICQLQSAQQSVTEDMSIDSLFQVWTDAVTTTLHSHTKPSLRRVPRPTKPKPQPWVTQGLKALLQKRRYAHRRALKNPQNKQLLWKYRNIRREGTLMNRRLREQYYLNLLRTTAYKPRLHWRVIKEVTQRQKVYTTPAAPIDELSSFFGKTVGNSSRAQLLCPQGPLPEQSLSAFTEITSQSVEMALKRLPTAKASGSDGIPPTLLRSLAEELSPTLANLFNESLSDCTVPCLYKIANVTPILKEGNPGSTTNYRPVSLLPICSKLLERFVFLQCRAYFWKFPTLGLPPEQFAYRRGHSCEDLLSIVINDWHKAMDAGKVTGVLFIDVRKAFDSVSHQQLLECLFDAGIGGGVLSWFSSYLENRFQRVVIGSNQSCLRPCQQGVPQGSVLGPFLFALYLRHLPSALQGTRVTVRLFADDICVYFSHESVHAVVQELELALGILHKWLLAKSLVINGDKSELLLVRSSRFVVPSDLCVRYGSICLTPSATVRYLGILIDCHLTFSDQVAALKRDIGGRMASFC